DITERGHWEDYQEAYQVALEKCSTDYAPWFVVPADRKWYARLAVQNLLLEHLRPLDLTWPTADFNVATERARLAKS
ncbi:MAG: polyphosphate kinase 2 family protein, partial [Ornithinimicrobium sp.]